MEQFMSGDVPIAYRDEGEGPPVLLIHGFGSNSSVNWDGTGWIRTLTESGYRTIAMDVRGHGRSAKLYEVEAYQLSIMARDAANLLVHLEISTAVVIGYSMGARISTQMAMDHPESIRGLVLGGMASGLYEGIGGEDRIIAGLLAETLEEVTTDVGRAYRKFADQTKSDRRALAACMGAQREVFTVEGLSEIAISTLVAVGTEDSISGSAPRLASVMPNARALEIEGRDHMSATGDRRFKDGTLEFISELD